MPPQHKFPTLTNFRLSPMSNDVFQSSDSVRSARPLKYAQHVTFHEPLESGAWRAAARDDRGLRDLRATQSAGRQRRVVCHALSGDSHVASHDPKTIPAGGKSSWGRESRSTPTATSLFVPKCLGRLPGHHRAEQHQPRDRPGLRHRLPLDHRRRHRQRATPADRPFRHQAAAGGRRRFAGRAHGADLGHQATPTASPAPWPSPLLPG